MSRISDIIEKFINDQINDSEGEIEIRRNEMATYFKCAPSQINYVLTTRFTADRGYYIESRRGGGGFIKITRVAINENDYLADLLSCKIGDDLNKEAAFELIEILYLNRLIDEKLKNIIKTALDDNTLIAVPRPLRDRLRADILKSVILAALVNV